jgi:hypothetical protein
MSDVEVQGEDYKRVRLRSGWLDLNRDETGIWRLRWTPDEGHPDWPGRTHSPSDLYLPYGYPGPDDPEALIAWGRALYGHL